METIPQRHFPQCFHASSVAVTAALCVLIWNRFSLRCWVCICSGFTPKLINRSYKWCKSSRFNRRRICIASVGFSYNQTKGHLIREKYTGSILHITHILIKLSFVCSKVHFKRLKKQLPQKCKSSRYCFTLMLMERGFRSPRNTWNVLLNTWSSWRQLKNNMQGLTCSSSSVSGSPKIPKSI